MGWGTAWRTPCSFSSGAHPPTLVVICCGKVDCCTLRSRRGHDGMPPPAGLVAGNGHTRDNRGALRTGKRRRLLTQPPAAPKTLLCTSIVYKQSCGIIEMDSILFWRHTEEGESQSVDLIRRRGGGAARSVATLTLSPATYYIDTCPQMSLFLYLGAPPRLQTRRPHSEGWQVLGWGRNVIGCLPRRWIRRTGTLRSRTFQHVPLV